MVNLKNRLLKQFATVLEKQARGPTTLRDPGGEKVVGIGLKEGTTESTSTKIKEYLQCVMALSLREPLAALRITLGKLLPYPLIHSKP